MAQNQQQLIEEFLQGKKEGITGSPSNPGTCKIKGNQLIHYDTPILERYGDIYIFNITRYSIQTGQLQKKIKTAIPEEKRIAVKQVPRDVKTSLKDFIKK
jgi:hypothetical protein